MKLQALNVSPHPDGFLVRVMRRGRKVQKFVAGRTVGSFAEACALADRLRVSLPSANPGRRTDLEGVR